MFNLRLFFIIPNYSNLSSGKNYFIEKILGSFLFLKPLYKLKSPVKGTLAMKLIFLLYYLMWIGFLNATDQSAKFNLYLEGQ